MAAVEEVHPLQKALDQAVSLGSSDQEAAEKAMREDVLGAEDSSPEALKIREQAVYRLGELFARTAQAAKLEALLRECRPFFRSLPKARTAKTVRTLVDLVGKIPGTLDLQVSLCKESVAWCKQEKRNFLRMRIQSKLAALLLDQGSFQPALALAQSLAREVKKLDDKPLLVEVHLTESKVHYALKNFPKARASLTAARTAAISVYLGPEVQARIDAQAGALAAEDRDYKTAYSYFFEGFEAASHMGEREAARGALRRMLLAKIMNGDTDDAMAIINGKHGVEHAGETIEAMRAVAQAYKARSLHAFLRAQRDFEGPLGEDVLVGYHLALLADTMLEANLLRVVEPYSRVELAHVAKSIALPLPRVEAKLSQMILDGGLRGTLDQGKGHLIVFRDAGGDPGYEAALKAVAALDGVVDGLFERAKGLS